VGAAGFEPTTLGFGGRNRGDLEKLAVKIASE
jgi:hypothetical protein